MTLDNIIQQIAATNHTTPQKIYAEMLQAFEEARNCSNPVVQARWNAIPHQGNEVMLEDLVKYIAALATLQK